MTNLLPMKLHDWLHQNTPDERMLWFDAFNSQISLFAERITLMLKMVRQQVYVVATHSSKGISLPVVQYRIPGKATITVSDNFFMLTVSVDAEVPLNFEIPDWLRRQSESRVASVYAYGFKEEWVYGPIDTNPQRFTVQVKNPDQVLVLMHLIGQALGVYR